MTGMAIRDLGIARSHSSALCDLKHDTGPAACSPGSASVWGKTLGKRPFRGFEGLGGNHTSSINREGIEEFTSGKAGAAARARGAIITGSISIHPIVCIRWIPCDSVWGNSWGRGRRSWGSRRSTSRCDIISSALHIPHTTISTIDTPIMTI
jgi:hypothetical protein